MALSQGSRIEDIDFNAIRTRIIAEFNTTNRRNIGSNYNAPAAAQSEGNFINATNVNNIAKNLYYVNSSTFSSNGISNGTLITANLNGIDTALITYEGKPKAGTNSGCKSGCVGLCQGCSNGCQSGCSGGCTSCSGCGGSCTSCTSCSGCSGGCSGCTGCSGGCTSCTGTCTSSCAKGCSDNCSGTC